MAGFSSDNHTFIIDRGWDQFIADNRTLHDSYVKAGFPDEGTTSGGYSYAEILEHVIANEFGVPDMNIPERPFMKQTIDKNLPEIYQIIDRELANLASGALTPKRFFNTIGEEIVSMIKLTMADGDFAENSEYTIKKKKGDQPLFDTHQMYHTVQKFSKVNEHSKKNTAGKVV